MRNRLIGFLLFLCASPLIVTGAQAASTLAPQSSREGGVSVQVTPRALSGSTWEFEFSINTHSGDLSEDLAKAVILVSDDGASRAPLGWEGAPPGGHHRKGVLRFKAITPQPQAIELKLQRPGEPAPRLFRWQLK
ncbi:MAG: hypothetical protein IH606_24220 [Burkholderiales bacterium]|nr:hypothetical protein [Burkholderiales bacterium]